ncbi:putative damage-inducible protein DinB [Mucilaginibacter frigoritolerans]|uniref:Putative damage-inducible protein DinB n=1 Tax=Mucilaginibacter frigoritolerans TaxID=652788 RepID=A0A562UCC3_9SPHI|nr:DinB family protein [Mucilaginibacter frigoritolerans]TWJ03462.1 putative damage-inducible protein DinB [Mucilaginibacter frigoritolerans]
MTISEQLTHDLENVLFGDPWYGKPVYTLLDEVGFETAFEKPAGSVHSIADIVLHMLAWTEEVLDRMNGLTAQLPSSGDWPEHGEPSEQKWQNYVNDLKLLNVNLLGVIRDFPEPDWNQPIKDERNPELGTGVSFEELVKGLIQHNIYHSAQVALLTRIIQIGA